MMTMTIPKTMTVSKRRLDSGPLHLRPLFNAGNPVVGMAGRVARLTGRHLYQLALDGRACPALAKGGLADSTMKGHRKALRDLSDDLPVDLWNAPLDRAILEMINRRRRNWH